jgi:hypothetical protein
MKDKASSHDLPQLIPRINGVSSHEAVGDIPLQAMEQLSESRIPL